MTVEELMRECDANEYELRRSAELIGIELAEDLEESHGKMLALAVMLQQMEFQPERIRMCCADPDEFPKQLQMELRDGKQDKELKRVLMEIEDLIRDSWEQEPDHWELLLNEVQMLWLMHRSGGAGFAPVSRMPVLILLVIVLAAALLLMPVLKELIPSLLGGIV